MTFVLKTNFLTNMFYYIEIISDVYKYKKPKYRKIFRKNLSKKDMELLKKYRKIRKKYNWDKWFEYVFTRKDMKTSMKMLKKHLKKKTM